MFGATVADDVIVAVHEQVPPGDAQAAVDTLLAMAAPQAPASAQAPRASAHAGSDLWGTLPEDCKLLIVGRLTIRDLTRVALACRDMARFAALCRARLSTVRCKGRIAGVASMLAAHANALCVDLTGLAPSLRHIVHFEDLAAELRRAVAARPAGVPLSRLHLRKCAALDDEALGLLLDSLPCAAALDLAYCGHVTDESLVGIAAREVAAADEEARGDALGLAGLHVSETKKAPASGAEPIQPPPRGGCPRRPVIHPRLAGRSVTFTGGITLSPAVRALLARTERPSGRDSDSEAPGGGSGDPGAAGGSPAPRQAATANGVTELHLKDCSVTEAGLRTLFAPRSRCRHSLAALDVSACPGVKLAFLNLVPAGSALRVVRADGCRAVTAVQIALPQDSVLRELSLRECPHLRSVAVVAPALEVLAVSASKMLREVQLTTPRLRRFLGNQCSHLAAWQCLCAMPRLLSVNLMGCTMLPATELRALFGHAPRLEYLNVTGCRHLSTLLVPEAVALERLVSQGSNLHSIAVQCASLRHLDARGCEHLEIVRLARPVATVDLRNCCQLREFTVSAPWEQAPGTLATAELRGCTILSKAVIDGVRAWARVHV